MAKKVAKLIEAGLEVKALVDKGAGIDTEIKNLGFVDKGIKSKLGELIGENIDLREGPSVKVAGDLATATITKKQALSLNAASELYPQVEDAMRSGLLVGVVEKTLGLAVAPDQIEKAAQALTKAGIFVTVTQSLSVVPEQDRPDAGSVQEQEAREVLASAVETKFSFAVKYETK